MVEKNENQNDNIISFPKEKVSAAKIVELPVVKRQNHASQKSKWLYGSLAMIFLTAIVVNSNDAFQSEDSTVQSRSLASVGVNVGLERNIKLETSIAKTISKPAMRKPASFGKSPSAADEFKFGFLESKYAVKFYHGKVQEVEFADGPNSNVEPRYLSDRMHFINKYKSLFSIPFSSTINLNREVVDQKIHETYALLDSNQTKVGQISFELDVYGRLLGMKVRSIQ